MSGGRDTTESLRDRIDSSLPSLSVVVAFKKGERCILDCLQSVLDMDYPMEKLEVIVIDDSADDSIAHTIRERFPIVRLLRNKSPLGCDGAKQIGINAATGDLIALTDADCTVPSSWARVIAKNLMDGADAVTGPVRHPRTLLRELIAVADFRDFQSAHQGWIDSFPRCNFAVREEDLRAVLYDRSGEIRGGSDRLLSWHLHSNGCRIRYDPSMLVHHAPAVNASSLLKRRLMYGRTALGMRKLDPTLPGSVLARFGILVVPAYISYKFLKDIYRLFLMAFRRQVVPWHVPALLPMLLIIRFVDAAGVATVARFLRSGTHAKKRR